MILHFGLTPSRHLLMNNQALHIQLEALLFALGRPASVSELAKMLGTSADEIQNTVREAQQSVRGVVIVDDGREIELRASRDATELIERVRREEFSRDIGRAGLEALAAVIYRGPLSRSEIDFIRGVNSSQTLRTLLMRGLLRKIPNPRDERSFLYEPTTDLLSQLGIERVSEAPEYEVIKQKLTDLEASYREASQS